MTQARPSPKSSQWETEATFLQARVETRGAREASEKASNIIEAYRKLFSTILSILPIEPDTPTTRSPQFIIIPMYHPSCSVLGIPLNRNYVKLIRKINALMMEREILQIACDTLWLCWEWTRKGLPGHDIERPSSGETQLAWTQKAHRSRQNIGHP